MGLLSTKREFLLFVQQYKTVNEKALDLFSSFQDSSSKELMTLQNSLKSEINRLAKMGKLKLKQCSELSRHLYFIEKNLSMEEKEKSSGDIKSILYEDLPSCLKNVLGEIEDEWHFDHEFRDKVLPLFQKEEYDSAVRKAFVVLTERIRKRFNIKKEIDGEQLINDVFGNKSENQISSSLSEKVRKNYRNLLSGFYGTYRNEYMHNDANPSSSKARALIEMINNVILEIDGITIYRNIRDFIEKMDEWFSSNYFLDTSLAIELNFFFEYDFQNNSVLVENMAKKSFEQFLNALNNFAEIIASTYTPRLSEKEEKHVVFLGKEITIRLHEGSIYVDVEKINLLYKELLEQYTKFKESLLETIRE